MATVTLQDVAQHAGVSKKTVSRVLNNEPSVAFDTFQRVQQAMTTLDYVPNTAARRLSSGKARNIGVILGLRIFVPYTSKLIESAVNEGNSLGYSISLFPIQGGSITHIVQAFRGKQVDGFILDTRAAMLPDLRKKLIAHQIPYVVVNPDSKRPHPRASFISIDDMQATKLGAEYLIGLGHREIGYVTVESKLYYHKRRLAGFKKALEQAGIAFREELLVGRDAEQTYEIGYHCGLELLHKHPELTAVYAATDNIAMGVMQAAWQLGLHIPTELSILGFDDVSYSIMTAPPLTTVHQPIDELASHAVRMLIQQMDDPAQEPAEVILPTHVEVRSSCAAPRQQPLPLAKLAEIEHRYSLPGGALHP